MLDKDRKIVGKRIDPVAIGDLLEQIYKEEGLVEKEEKESSNVKNENKEETKKTSNKKAKEKPKTKR